MQAFSRRFRIAGFSSPILRVLTFVLSDLLTSLTSQLEKSLPDLRALPILPFSMVRVRKPDNREVSEAPEIRENDLRKRSERSGRSERRIVRGQRLRRRRSIS